MEVAFASGLFLTVFISGSLWLRLERWSLTDVFLLAVAVYFGAYTLIDVSVSKEAPRFDSAAALLVFTLIGAGTLALWWFARARTPMAEETSLTRLQADWRACPPLPIVALIVLALWHRWYTATFFAEYEGLGQRELEFLEQGLPYWFTSIGMVVATTILAVGMCAWEKARSAIGVHKLFWLGMTGAAGLVAIGMGRRAIFVLLVIFGWTLLKNRRGWRSVAVLLLSAPMLFVLSNVYQAYRLVSHRGVPLESIAGFDDAGSIVDSAIAANRTIENLQERQAMWRFNHEVIKAHIDDSADLMYGALLMSDFPNYVPSILNPGKKWVDSEETLLLAFKLDLDDRPSNLFAYTYADFGVLSAIATPAMMLGFVWLCAFALRRIRDPFLRLLLMGMAITYALNLETGYLVQIGYIRDFVMVSCAYLAARWLWQTGGMIVRTAHASR